MIAVKDKYKLNKKYENCKRAVIGGKLHRKLKTRKTAGTMGLISRLNWVNGSHVKR